MFWKPATSVRKRAISISGWAPSAELPVELQHAASPTSSETLLCSPPMARIVAGDVERAERLGGGEAELAARRRPVLALAHGARSGRG